MSFYFLQEGFVMEDDFGAADDFTRENDVEAEFLRGRKLAEEEQERRRAESGAAPPQSDAPQNISSSQPSPQGVTRHHEFSLLDQIKQTSFLAFHVWCENPLWLALRALVVLLHQQVGRRCPALSWSCSR